MAIIASNYDGKQLGEFYDPHPCPAGEEMAVPAGIKEVLDKLNGQSMAVDDAVFMLMDVAGENVVLTHTTKNCICLQVRYDHLPYDLERTFILIKFR